MKKIKKCFAIWKKTYFLLNSYLAALLGLYFKDDLVSLRRKALHKHFETTQNGEEELRKICKSVVQW